MAALFIGFLVFVGSLVLFLNAKSALRTSTARRHWRKTRGRVEKFTYHYGNVAVRYSYSVAGEPYSASHLCVSPFASQTIGAAASLDDSFYLNKNGALRFQPGSEADVYFDPASPADAALVVERANVSGFGVFFGFLLVAVGVLFSTQKAWLTANALKGMGSFFLLASLLLFNMAWKTGRRSRATQKALAAPGCITGGELHFTPGNRQGNSKGRGGYSPHIKFEYTVDDTRYRSTQISALPLRVIRDAAAAQQELDRWLQKQHVTVYYLPEKPWDAFLLHGPKGATLLPLIIGACSAAFGVVLMVVG